MIRNLWRKSPLRFSWQAFRGAEHDSDSRKAWRGDSLVRRMASPGLLPVTNTGLIR